MTTILTCCDAFGNFLPHQVVYKGRNLMKAWVQGGASDVYHSTSKSGWMESENFIEWFRSIFLVYANKLQGSKILFLDGHASHINFELKRLSESNNIILFRLPAHTSHFLQPLDVGVFKTVKAGWKRIVEAYLVRNSYSSLSNRQFPAMMKDLIANKGFKAENARSGFENTGIFPLNRSKITPNKTAIRAIFQDVTNDKIENCFSRKSTDSQVSLDKTNQISSKHSMNRLSTKEVLLKELDSIKNAVKQASFDKKVN